MTSKEAFETLKRYEAELLITKQTEVAYDVVTSARYEISKLVERDTPIKVIKEVDKKYIDTYEFYKRDIYRCGSCKKVLLVDRYQRLQDNEKTNYCSHCGQRIDWEEE